MSGVTTSSLSLAWSLRNCTDNPEVGTLGHILVTVLPWKVLVSKRLLAVDCCSGVLGLTVNRLPVTDCESTIIPGSFGLVL